MSTLRPAIESVDVGAGRDDPHAVRCIETLGIAGHPLALGIPVP